MAEGTLNMKELVKRVATATGSTQKQAREFVEATFEELKGAVANHEKIAIAGYLKGGAKYVSARTRRNPRDGSVVEKEAGYKLVLKAGSKLVAAI
ncbi:hypothetical protein QB910_000011 [Dabrowskivirus KKP3916]|uniref:DNA-binding protein n=1 Tax=Alicyclobacillus phage KKP_3916 TaxID=3040651 RepID=A0AAT9V7J2_9CAUD|nr:hypothetical protein QB910_000011 [Alicyclobacillus phage KKP 3916]